MLSQTHEYALRAAVFLASEEGRPRTARQIAAATSVPPGYLAKVLQQLVRGGIATSQRGLHGGFLLARPAGQLPVLDVVNAVDPIQRIRSCPLGLAEHAGTLCALHNTLDRAYATIERSFARATLADLSGRPTAAGDPCAWPAVRKRSKSVRRASARR
jgi:Rrf2 family nitric oxide-sensitive transcriptional repressor